MRTMLRENLLNLLGIFFSLFFLILCYYSINLEIFYQALRLPYPLHLLWLPVFDVLVMLARAIRWKYILYPSIKISSLESFELMAIGGMGNNVIPLKAGEIIRAVFLAKKTGQPINKILSSIGLEHILDGVGLILIIAVLLFTMEIPHWFLWGIKILFVIVLTSLLVLCFLWKIKIDVEKWKHKNHLLRWFIEFFYHFGHISKEIRSPKKVFLLTLNTLIIWTLVASGLIFIHSSFGMGLNIRDMFFVLVAFVMATALPSAPGSIGTFEYACILAYHFLGISKEIGLSLGFYFHMMQFIPITLMGLFYYFRWSKKLQVTLKMAKTIKRTL